MAQLVEQGRYAELVELGGLFAELDAQGKFVPDVEEETGSHEESLLMSG